MARLLLAFSLLIALPGLATDVFVPPVPKGIRGERVIQYRGPVPLPSAKAKWVRVTTPRFRVVSSASERTAIEVAQNLETLASALGSRFKARGFETRVFLFARRRESQPYFDLLVNRRGARTPGLFVVHEDGSGTMVIDATTSWTDRTVVHELVHNLLASAEVRLPLWLEEGIAEYFSTAEVHRGKVHIGATIREHALAVRGRQIAPLGAIFRAQYDSPIAASAMFYAQSWSVVDWLMRADEQRFYQFVADLERGAETENALRARFGVTPAELERSLRQESIRPVSRQQIDVALPEVSTYSEPLTHEDALVELGTFLGLLTIGREDAERHLVAAGGHPAAIAARATIRAYDKKYDEAYALFEEALRIAPDGERIRIAYAEALLQNSFGPFAGVSELADDAAERFKKARTMVLWRTDNPVCPGARDTQDRQDCLSSTWLRDAILGSTYLAEPDPTPGLPPLERALAARPARIDIALNLYALLLRTGQKGRADALFDTVFKNARRSQTVLAARAVYVRERLTLVNRLIADQKMDEASEMVRELIAVTPDATAKRDLEGELRKLTAVADANREILSYNAAVDAANRGQKKKALALLDGLLASARDAKVIADAKALRQRLKGNGRANV